MAERRAREIPGAEERAEAFASMAAVALGVLGRPLLSRVDDRWPAWLPAVQACAVQVRATGCGQAAEGIGERWARARHFLGEVLTGDDWWHALPVLAHIDPTAVRRVRDVVFAHLGLERG